VLKLPLLAGTSSGVVFAGGFAYGLKTGFFRQMYQGFGEESFADSIWDDLKDLKFLIGADYSLTVSMRWLITSVVRYCMKITSAYNRNYLTRPVWMNGRQLTIYLL
jgi:hypothetical protein